MKKVHYKSKTLLPVRKRKSIWKTMKIRNLVDDGCMSRMYHDTNLRQIIFTETK